jgi:NAD(P)-dependent dehydrogenase (short-subunit alcohol dehydrogenase family)
MKQSSTTRLLSWPGSSSGNGRAIALALAANGASVVCSDIRREAREGGNEGEIITAHRGASCLFP